MDMQYQLKAGSYYLYDMREAPSKVTGERRFKLKTDMVAIAFDVQTGEVHRHGNPTRIQSWAQTQRWRLLKRLATLPHGKLQRKPADWKKAA